MNVRVAEGQERADLLFELRATIIVAPVAAVVDRVFGVLQKSTRRG